MSRQLRGSGRTERDRTRNPGELSRSRSWAGFTLVELLISLAVLMLALALAAQLLAESARMLSDVAAEQRDLPVPLALGRIRADVRAATAFAVVPGGGLWLSGLPGGDVLYARESGELVRRVADGVGAWGEPAPLLREVTAWSAVRLGPRLLRLDVSYQSHARRRGTPLAVLPGVSGTPAEIREETLLLAPRGAGLGTTW